MICVGDYKNFLTINEKLEQWIDEDFEAEAEAKAEIEAEATEDEELDVTDQLWHQEMVQLVEEHDHQLWFLGAIARLFKPISSSQYSWLKNLRYQT